MSNLAKIITISLVIFFVSSASYGKELVIGVGNFAPFFIKDGNRGLFLDLTKEVFKLIPQYDIKFIFMSNKRLILEINKGNIDAACNIFEGSNIEAHLSDPLFRYTDVAITVKRKNFVIDKISDLRDKRIVAYQGATDLLGEEFKKMALSNPAYKEHSIPSATTSLLVKDRADVRIGDIFIFLYDISRPKYKGKINIADFTIHRLWPDVYSHIAFKDQKVRDEVNKAIKKIKENATFDDLYRKYEQYLKTEDK